MLLIRFLISCLIPDKPNWVATEMAKVEFARREAVNRISSATTTPPSSGTTTTITAPSDTNLRENLFLDNLKPHVGADSLSRRYNKINFLACDENFIGFFLCRSSEGSDTFQAAVNSVPEVKSSDTVESDFSESVDNIDRILQNIDEEKEDVKVIKRGISRESESSGDYTGTSISSEPAVGKRSIVKKDRKVLNSVKNDKDWAVSTDENLDRQASTSGHSGSWYKNLNTRRIVTNLEKNYGNCRSTSCIPTAQKEYISSNESVLSTSPPVVKFQPEERIDSAGSENSSATEEVAPDPVEKKKRLKSALIKRARSVAVFSLKLKERRAKAESKEVEKIREKVSPRTENVMVGGELSCVPIEMLISIDDVNNMKYQKKNSSAANSKAGTPTVPFPNR